MAPEVNKILYVKNLPYKITVNSLCFEKRIIEGLRLRRCMISLANSALFGR